MKLPHFEQAIIPPRKITAYLLSPTHHKDRDKAAFFARFGFSLDVWELLAHALREHAATHDVATIENTPFGTSYTVEGALTSPDGRTPLVRVVWFIETGETVPRLVSAYPRRGLKK